MVKPRVINISLQYMDENGTVQRKEYYDGNNYNNANSIKDFFDDLVNLGYADEIEITHRHSVAKSVLNRMTS